MTTETITMPVSGRTNAKKVAGAVRERYREDPQAKIELSAIGYPAVANAVKGVVELNKLMAGGGRRVLALPFMEDRPVKDSNGTVMRTVTVFRLCPEDL